MKFGIYQYNGEMYLFESICRLLDLKQHQRIRHIIQTKGCINGHNVTFLGNAKITNVYAMFKDGKHIMTGCIDDITNRYYVSMSTVVNDHRLGFKLLGEYNLVFKRRGLFLDGVEVFPK